MQQTVNGFVGGPNGEMDWMTMAMDDELKNYVMGITDPVDCIIMGRKLAQGFIPYWAAAAANPETPGQEFAKKMNDTQKVVFSKTLEKSEWENTQLAKGDIVDEVNRLKNQPGGDIIVYGGAEFVANLIQNGLIDELHLSVNPVAIGSGLTIFRDRQNLELVKATSFSCGKVVLLYEPSKK